MEKTTLENHVIKPSVSIFDNSTEYRLLPESSEVSLDEKISKIEFYMISNNGFGKSEEEKDKIYEQAKTIWHSFTNEFKEVVYTFYLNKDQYTYIMDLLKNKLEYDVNTVFFAMELINLLGEWSESGTNDAGNLKGYLADATETTYIYHLLAKHKVKGMNDETKLFSEILLKIGEISKIVSYYDTHAKSLSKKIQEWVAGFDAPINPMEPQQLDFNYNL